MDKTRIIMACAVIASTLKDSDGPQPLGLMYAALNTRKVSFSEWQIALSIVTGMGLCKTTSETATYTSPMPGSKGEQFIAECDKIMALAHAQAN